MTFDWDDANTSHIARHKVTAQEAEQVLQNQPVDLEEQQIDGEDRFLQVGETTAGRVLIVAATLRGNAIRVISAWDAEASTKRQYLLQKGLQHGIFPENPKVRDRN